MAGQNVNLNNDSEILKINSPQQRLKGPFKVIKKDEEQRFAFVALEWDGEPAIGFRWFWGTMGTPVSNHTPIWEIIPEYLYFNIVEKSDLKPEEKVKVLSFLYKGGVTGEDLLKL